jgi:hypothetical protein
VFWPPNPRGSSACTEQTAPQALCGYIETWQARCALYVPVQVSNSLLSRAQNGVSAPVCLVVYLLELSGDPQGLSLAVRPVQIPYSPLSISLSIPAAPSASSAGPTALLVAVSILSPIASGRTLRYMGHDVALASAFGSVFKLLRRRP